jgi:hypothetical protein
MAYPVWPGSLPEPIIGDYQVNGELPVTRTPMESGRPRVHRTTNTIMRQVSYSIALTETQSDTFWDFFEDEGNTGADFFEMNIDTGRGMATHLCRFTSYPSTRKITGNKYMISGTIETDQQVAA